MSNPLAEYLSALEARDAREQAQATVINAYTKLADRNAALHQQSREVPTEPSPPSPSPSAKSTKSLRPDTPKGKGSSAPQEPISVTQLRADLAATQKARVALESTVASQRTELDNFKVSDAAQKKEIAQLKKTKEALERRIRDRAEELAGKGQLAQNVQDEMLALHIQLNLAEDKIKKLEADSEDLTKRWMEKMKQEAESMNMQSGFGQN
ncbi:autophagy protein 16 [Zopfia rhizophila CBS 207.26]|uniref:Autophagy protein 16 n=1 Tax=Zopfia rhizophila CBS 207.26 TaxID=1314779 RepID=A0A6A6DTB8_9PEZI|nr:autophagy protein 16 [Zopfia rhizophila CBS 207.26]